MKKFLVRMLEGMLLLGTTVAIMTGCANNGNFGNRADMNNVANQVHGTESGVLSELNGNETAVNVLVVEDGDVKSKPENDAPVIGRVAAGNGIVVLDSKENSGYLKVSFNGRVGYLAVRCCKLEKDNIEGETEQPIIVPEPTMPAQIPTIQVKPTQPTVPRPTEAPTEAQTTAPTETPTEAPTEEPTEAPTEAPTEEPTEAPTEEPTEAPTEEPTEAPTEEPTEATVDNTEGGGEFQAESQE